MQTLLAGSAAGTGPLDPFPDTFYVAFRFRVAQTEIDDNDGGDFVGFNCGGGINAGEYGLTPFRNVLETDYTILSSVWPGPQDDYDISATPISATTWYVIDVKIERTSDHLHMTATVRLDGVSLGTGTTWDSGSPWNIFDFAAGALHNFRISSRDMDYFTIGSTTWGTTDIFNCDFSSLAPFDTLEGTGVSIGSGMLSIVNSGSYGDALKTL